MNMDIGTIGQFPSICVREIQFQMLTDMEMEIGPCKGLQQKVESLEDVPASAEEKELLPPFLDIFPAPSLPGDWKNSVVDPDDMWKPTIGLDCGTITQANNSIRIIESVLLVMFYSPV
jgi:hypothetical protein